ncbi:hypothetical protein FQN54_007595 [Arachnomyces sp. PD_36]|nr:hypothetical protein FQN54_007595 [Arachnomyces sp. PD_36]
MEVEASNPPYRTARTYGLPIFNGGTEGKKPLLLVYLTSLNEAAEEKLTELLRPAINCEDDRLHRWYPSAAVLEYIAYPCAYTDSQARLYAVAILAYRAGWAGLLVADNLTKRQLEGTTKFGESRLPTVVLISIKPNNLSSTRRDDQVRVVAKRTIGWDGESAEIPRMLERIEPWEVLRAEEMYRRGVVLHDPDRDALTPDTASLLGREELSNATHGALSRLPTELVDDILTRVKGDDDSPSVEPPPLTFDPENLNIFLLFTTTPEELGNLQSTIQKAVDRLHEEGALGDRPEVQVKLIPWENHQAKSRRQLQKLCDVYQDRLRDDLVYAETYCFLPEPVKETENIQLGVYYDNIDYPLNISLKPLHKLLNLEIQGMETDASLNAIPCDVEYLDHKNNELFLRPDEPFYASPPIWRYNRLKFTCITVFYLTNKLSDEQDKAIREEMQKPYEFDVDDYMSYCFVPWKSGHKDEPDGTLEDMWEILWNTYKEFEPPVFCIDQQSGVDLKLIALAGKFFPITSASGAAVEALRAIEYSDLRGMYYGRAPAISARNVYANISTGNMDIEETLEPEVVHVYPRPDWPHEVVGDVDSEEDG